MITTQVITDGNHPCSTCL